MTQRIFGMVAAVLAGLMVALSLSIAALAVPQPLPARPAGCHDRPAPKSAPAPVSYECCATGHNVAFRAASFVVHPLAISFRVAGETELPFAANQFSRAIAILKPLSSESPPGLEPLRV